MTLFCKCCQDSPWRRAKVESGIHCCDNEIVRIIFLLQLPGNAAADPARFLGHPERLRPRLDIKSLKKGAQQLSFDYDSGCCG